MNPCEFDITKPLEARLQVESKPCYPSRIKIHFLFKTPERKMVTLTERRRYVRTNVLLLFSIQDWYLRRFFCLAENARIIFVVGYP